MSDDQQAIDAVVAAFFRAFDNTGGAKPALDSLHALCLPGCVIVKAVGATPEVSMLPEFIAPRAKLLAGGGLTEFSEHETQARTDRFGNVAQRFSSYRKSGVLDGVRFATEGRKSIQLIRTPAGWRISAVAWDDERGQP